MTVPICCGKRGTPYRREYPNGSWEEGYRCKKCGRIRLFTIDPERDARMKTFMDSLDAIREEGMKFDAELAAEHLAKVQALALSAQPGV